MAIETNQKQRMDELQRILKEASDAYYNGEEVMSNREYDALYDELVALEKETGVVYPDSITQTAGSEVVDSLPKVTHEYPALSLAKTKDPSELSKQMGKNKDCSESVLMWKMDGCFAPGTLILMGDGKTYTSIEKINIGDSVMSFNEKTKKVEPCKVTNVFNNGRKELKKWCQITLDTNKCPVTCTKDHLFFTKNGFVPANELQVNDTVYYYNLSVNNEQEQFLLGAMLGDGCFFDRRTNKDKTIDKLQFHYCKTNKEPYISYMNNISNFFEGSKKEFRVSGYNSEIYRLNIHSIGCPSYFYNNKNWLKAGFTFTKEICSKLTSLSLAILYIDNGSRCPSKDDGYNVKNVQTRASIQVDRHPKEFVEIFSEWLNKNGYENNIQFSKKCKTEGCSGLKITMTAEGSKKFFDDIAPYVPKAIRPIKLGLKDCWQNAKEIFWWENNQYVPTLFEGKIVKIVDKYKQSTKRHSDFIPSRWGSYSFDLEVEKNHSYFAEGFAVHNCTLIATYDGGKLKQLATRGNGAVGSDITHNAPYINGLPQTIPFKGHMVVRGEAVMTYTEFERINSELPPDAEKYKNPRNLANSTISLLDSREMRTRDIQFYAFNNVAMIDQESGLDVRHDEFSLRLKELEDLGFQVVEHRLISNDAIEKSVAEFTDAVEHIDFPVDGLVIASEDAAYAEKQPGTGHNPNNLVGFAFKWEDELVKTTLRDIEWSVGRTGVITPVAIFDPVEICGTTVSRASMHNLSEMKRVLKTNPYVGQEIEVFKANMIIPQVNSGKAISSLPSGEQMGAFQKIINHPENCPCCGANLVEKQTQGGSKKNPTVVETLNCVNEECPQKQIGAIEHFSSRDCMNIVGLSSEKIAFLIENGYIKNRADIFVQANVANDVGVEAIVNANGKRLVDEEGWGVTSVKNLVEAVIKAEKTDFVSFVHSLGIPNVGKGQAKLLRNYIEDNVKELCPDFNYNNQYPIYSILTDMFDKEFDFTRIEGFGEVINKSLYEFRDKYVGTSTKPPKSCEVEGIYDRLDFSGDLLKDKSVGRDGVDLTGKTFVVTGDVHIFKNRNELTAKIEELGGKCSGSVSAKTSYLINNDVNSTSGKNQKAKQLGIPIISEDDFVAMIGGREEERDEPEMPF